MIAMLGFEQHDHHQCVTDGIKAAEAYCAEKGLRFTETRKRVLEILLEGHRALGAYDILEVLHSEGRGSQPPVAYRALDFLVEHRFAHKIERLNAFVACGHIGETHAPIFLICNTCDAVAEAHADPANNQVLTLARKSGFAVERLVAEVIGTCPDCQ